MAEWGASTRVTVPRMLTKMIIDVILYCKEPHNNSQAGKLAKTFQRGLRCVLLAFLLCTVLQLVVIHTA